MTRFDDQLIRRYLAYDLDEAELDAFEEAMLDDPRLLARVEDERRFRDGFRAMAAEQERESASNANEAAPTLVERLHSLVFSPIWTFSVSAAALFLGTALLFSTPETPVPGGVVVDEVVYLARTRSDGEQHQRIMSGNRTMLIVDVLAFGNHSVEVTVLREGQVVRAFGDITPNDDRQLNLVLDPLRTGAYELVVQGGGSTERYEFSVTAE